MKFPSEMKLSEAINLFYTLNGFPTDGGVSEDKWSPYGCRDLKVYLPNFEWRKKAIPFHDLHHILTGYPCSPIGEFQISAWEFAAGKYPNLYTTLFCIPLVSMGAILIPKKQFKAFVRGRQSKTLYENYSYEALLDMTIGELTGEILPKPDYKANAKDFYQYIRLVFLSGAVVLTPFLTIFFIIKGLI